MDFNEFKKQLEREAMIDGLGDSMRKAISSNLHTLAAYIELREEDRGPLRAMMMEQTGGNIELACLMVRIMKDQNDQILTSLLVELASEGKIKQS